MALAAPILASRSISIADAEPLAYTIPKSVEIITGHVVNSLVYVDGIKVYGNEEMTAKKEYSIPITVFARHIGKTAQIGYSVAGESDRDYSDKTEVEIKP